MSSDTTIPGASAIAAEAFVLAYPLLVMNRTMAQATAVAAPEPETMRAPVNALVYRRDTPDTLRASGWLELADEPLVLSVPATHGRYYALWLRDAWTGVFASLGARTTGTASHDFALVGPEARGRHVPRELTPIAAPTRIVHLAACIEAAGGDDAAWARRGFGLTSLQAWHRDGAPARVFLASERDPAGPVEQVERMDARAFFSEASRLIDDNPSDPACRAALDRLRGIDAWGSPPPGLRESVERGLWAGRATVRAASERLPGEPGASWRVCSEVCEHADRPLRRACAARAGLLADPASDVLHAQLDRDSDGRPLSGRGRYVLRFAPDAPPPVHGFWSLETRAAGTPVSAHSVGDLHGLAIDPDGSLPVNVQHRPPARKRRANWLPAPAGGFSLALHLYWPRDEVLQRRWSPPPLLRVG